MDRSLQERLVGAAVLVALGVWLIPWVLDGSVEKNPEQVADTRIQLPVPEKAQNVPIRRETIELGSPRSSGLKSSAPASEREVEPDAEVESPPANADAAAEPPPVQAATDTQTQQATARETPQTPQPAPRSSEVLPAILEASPVAGWMVQLGSFSDAGNAQRQAQRIGTYGHDARIYEFATGGRTMFRVRLGPIETRERAEAAASALSAQGFVAQLVAPE